jgi:hypothetical protein
MAKINEAALRALVEAEDGPVGRLVAQIAQEVVDAPRANAAVIMHRLPEVVEAIDYAQTGTTAVIGIRDHGRIVRYLVDKEHREHVMLLRAVGEVFGEK